MTDQLSFDYRNSDPPTSRDAAIYNLPNRGAHQQLVLAALQAAGEYGLTDFDIEDETGIKQTSCGKRRLELVRAGLAAPRMVIGQNGLEQDRRKAPSGTPSLVWVAVEFQRSDAADMNPSLWPFCEQRARDAAAESAYPTMKGLKH